MRKVILVTIDNGLEYSDHDWDIVGIYTLDQEAAAIQDGRDQLLELFDGSSFYHAATVTVRKVWINKLLDYTASTIIAKIGISWNRTHQPEATTYLEEINA
jgi:hypothetical protein